MISRPAAGCLGVLRPEDMEGRSTGSAAEFKVVCSAELSTDTVHAKKETNDGEVSGRARRTLKEVLKSVSR